MAHSSFRGFARIVSAFALTTAISVPALAGFEWRGPITPPSPPASSDPSASAPTASDSQGAPVSGDLSGLEPVVKWNGDTAPPAMPVVKPATVEKSTVTTLATAPAAVDTSDAIQGFGANIPLAIAVQQIIPAGYLYSFTSGVNPGDMVSWSGGKPWKTVLSDMLALIGLSFKVDQSAVVVGYFDVNKAAIPVSPVVNATVTPSVAPAPVLSPMPASPSPVLMQDMKKSELEATPVQSEPMSLASPPSAKPMSDTKPEVSPEPKIEVKEEVRREVKQDIQPEKNSERVLLDTASQGDVSTPSSQPVDVRREKPEPLLEKWGVRGRESIGQSWGNDRTAAIPPPPLEDVSSAPSVAPSAKSISDAKSEVSAEPKVEVNEDTQPEKNSERVLLGTASQEEAPISPSKPVDVRQEKPEPLLERWGITGKESVGHSWGNDRTAAIPPPPLEVVSSAPSQNAALEKTTEKSEASAPAPAAASVSVDDSSKKEEKPATTSPAALSTWRAAKGETLREALAKWSETAGVEMYWSIDYDYRLGSDAMIEGAYDDAVGKLLDRFKTVRPQPYGQLHQPSKGARVLVVKSYDISG